ncbi:transposase [Nostoc sp. NIES-4103]|nr:transposase [Nostoc sp. NIES-4103]
MPLVNLSHYIVVQFRQQNPGADIVDIKAYCRGFRYVLEMLKMLPQTPEPILLTQIFAKLTSLGRIHNAFTAIEPS